MRMVHAFKAAQPVLQCVVLPNARAGISRNMLSFQISSRQPFLPCTAMCCLAKRSSNICFFHAMCCLAKSSANHLRPVFTAAICCCSNTHSNRRCAVSHSQRCMFVGCALLLCSPAHCVVVRPTLCSTAPGQRENRRDVRFPACRGSTFALPLHTHTHAHTHTLSLSLSV
jgi:hypothetical protein